MATAEYSKISLFLLLASGVYRIHRRDSVSPTATSRGRASRAPVEVNPDSIDATTASHSAEHDASPLHCERAGSCAPTFTRGSTFHVWKANLSDRNRCLLGYRRPCIDHLVLRTDLTALDRNEGHRVHRTIIQRTLATNPDGTSSTLHPGAGLSRYSGHWQRRLDRAATELPARIFQRAS